MSQKDITCCFTGHRPRKLPWGLRESDSRCIDTKKWIFNHILDLYLSGFRRYYCGMAIGCDMYFAEQVIELKQKYPDVLLFGAIPCADQTSGWNIKQRLRYSELLEQFDDIELFSETYSKTCMDRRNRFMVDESSVLLACFNGSHGGTMNTILYAQREGLEIRMLDINQLVREEDREKPEIVYTYDKNKEVY